MSDNTIEFRNAMGKFCSGVVIVTGIQSACLLFFSGSYGNFIAR